MNQTGKNNPDPKIGRTIVDDFKKGNLRKGIRRDYKDMKEFFINDERKKRLLTMGRFKRWFYMSWWLLKGLFFNLTPIRRVLFVLSLILILTSKQVVIIGQGQAEVSTNFNLLGAILLIFIIMLELKDKLLAKTELSEGRSIQSALMPNQNPAIPGWDVWMYSRPANDVGGDLVDYLPLDSNKYGLSLADVSGKGLGAALFMAKLQATIRALAPDYTSLSQFISKLNQIFHRDTIANRFASLLYLQIEAKNSEIKYINAGHFPPLIIEANKIRELSKGDVALGLSPSSSYKEQSIILNENEIFFVYSDGLTEAMSESSVFFGEQRLKDLLLQLKKYPANYIGENILKQVDYFMGEKDPTDDLSMIILKKR
ncbi:MAG: PP2C family protein-serine/threonine phosphatase [Calditrichaceae bacterium]|nr:PP2C family protein-serine/threonine phosphatase [Calditrichaceae bacterium]